MSEEQFSLEPIRPEEAWGRFLGLLTKQWGDCLENFHKYYEGFSQKDILLYKKDFERALEIVVENKSPEAVALALEDMQQTLFDLTNGHDPVKASQHPFSEMLGTNLVLQRMIFLSSKSVASTDYVL